MQPSDLDSYLPACARWKATDSQSAAPMGLQMRDGRIDWNDKQTLSQDDGTPFKLRAGRPRLTYACGPWLRQGVCLRPDDL
mmetsp:Transcript_8/g.37  ORF Transcript_8/g.37 Transcript_8/m.37 type:complete len:81 (+) Transcript_8:1880-2122(+)